LLSACGGGGGGGDDIIPAFTLCTGIAMGDLNGDNAIDIVTSNIRISGKPPHPGHLRVILQNPIMDETFNKGIKLKTGSDPQFVAIGDLNNDTIPDLISTNYGNNTLSVILQDDLMPGYFLDAINYQTGSMSYGAAIGDINDDGLNDIVSAGSYISLFLNTPGNPGSFYYAGKIDIYASSLAISDLNGDGRVDLASTGTGSGLVSVMLQDAAPAAPGRFSKISSYSAGYQPINLAIADVDGDGKDDLVIANYGTPEDPHTASVSVLIQEHDPTMRGVFRNAASYKTGARTSAVAISDLNGDGKFDLAAANAGHIDDTGSVSILLQSTTPGVFLSAKNLTGISQPLSVAISDVNKDGLNDLAIADGGASVRYQNIASPGNFLPPVLVGR